MSFTCVIDWRTLADWRERVNTQFKAVRSISMIRKPETESLRLETVFLLLPTEHNKLTLQWQGPHEVQQVVNQMYSKFCVKGKTKISHAKLLKLYHERADKAADITLQPDVAGMVVIGP